MKLVKLFEMKRTCISGIQAGPILQQCIMADVLQLAENKIMRTIGERGQRMQMDCYIILLC